MRISLQSRKMSGRIRVVTTRGRATCPRQLHHQTWKEASWDRTKDCRGWTPRWWDLDFWTSLHLIETCCQMHNCVWEKNGNRQRLHMEIRYNTVPENEGKAGWIWMMSRSASQPLVIKLQRKYFIGVTSWHTVYYTCGHSILWVSRLFVITLLAITMLIRALRYNWRCK